MENQVYCILENKYIVYRKIGNGGCSKVYLTKNVENEEILALKILKSSLSNAKYNETEKENLQKLNHPNIISIKDCGEGSMEYPDGRSKIVNYLVLEYAQNGELFDYVYYPKAGFGEKMARPIFIQLVEAISSCHNSNVAHRDLKTENIMMNYEWRVKLADFGFSKLITNKKMETMLGTLNYMAPEILRKEKYDGSSCDIFSLGVILFILVTGIPPYKIATINDPYYRFFYDGNLIDYWNLITLQFELSDDFKTLVSSLLSVNPNDRPSASLILNSAWVKGELVSFDEYENEFERRKKIIENCKQIQEIQNSQRRQNNQNGLKYRDIESDNSTIFLDDILIKNADSKSLFYKKDGIKLTGDQVLGEFNNIVTFFKNDKCVSQVILNKKSAKFIVMYQSISNYDIDFELENLEIEIELKKIDNSNYIVEFTKLKGDKFDFYQKLGEFANVHSKNFNE